MLNRLVAIVVLFVWFSAASAQGSSVAKVKVLSNGVVLLNDRKVTMAELEVGLMQLKTFKGTAWYFRENAQAEPGPEALAVIELIVKHRVPVSLSSKPDFSDTIDSNGDSRARKN